MTGENPMIQSWDRARLFGNTSFPASIGNSATSKSASEGQRRTWSRSLARRASECGHWSAARRYWIAANASTFAAVCREIGNLSSAGSRAPV